MIAVLAIFRVARDREECDFLGANARFSKEFARHIQTSPRGIVATPPLTTFSIYGRLTPRAKELETQPEIGARVEIIAPQEAQMLIDDAQEIGRMINGLVKSLERGEHVRSEEVSDRAR